MKKNIIAIILAGLTTSCNIGVSELKVTYPDNQNFYIEKIDTKVQDSKISTKEVDKDINVIAEWVGNGYPIATGKGVTGLTNRFVIPYTRLTSLVNLKIVNNSDKYIDFNNNDITLTVSDTQSKPLNVDFFKNRWPSFSVKSQEMLIDRSVAIGEIIRTIIRDEKIPPKTTHQGYMAFLKVPDNAKSLNLSTTLKVDNEIKNIDFRFIRK